MMQAAPSFFQRFLLPGFAFKAVVIGGGYATGRELAEFFLPCGLRGGLFGMLVSMVLWSVVCAVTFLFARATHSQDYRSFFRHLLGRGWFVFEIAYVLLLMLILSVFGAAAGAIGEALVGAPPLVGTLCLAGAIALVTAYGSNANQRAAAVNAARARPFPRSLRLIVSLTLLLTSIFIANRFGLVTLIGRGYRALTVLFLIVFVVPLLTLGMWQLFHRVGESNCPSESVS
jgi:uncharacterized membrane protein YkvI